MPYSREKRKDIENEEKTIDDRQKKAEANVIVHLAYLIIHLIMYNA